MPYNRPYSGGFQDFPNTTTPIDASALNTMDVGIKTANDQFQTVTTAQRATLTPSVGQAVWDSDLKQLMVYMNASGGNAWQPVGNRIVCASTTRPSSPFEGQEIYETDTQKTLVYSGSAWVETNDLDYSPSATVCTSGTRPATGLFEGQRIYETDTNREFTYSGSGWVQTNQWSTTSGVTGVNNLIVPPICKATKTTNQAIPNAADTLITFDTEVIDTDEIWASGGEFTVKTAGVYIVTAQLTWVANGTGQRAGFLSKNATSFSSGVMAQTILGNVGASAQTIFNLVTMENFAVNDVIRLYAYQTSGGNLDVQGTTANSGYKTQMNISWVGRTS